MAACVCVDVPIAQAAAALTEFSGTQRRLEVVGTARGVTVIDDFGHNPDKIAASLATMKESKGRLITIFQPHGYGPMKLMGAEIINVITQYLDDNEIFVMPDIYDAGGTADRSISSADTIAALSDKGVNAHHIGARKDIAAFIKDNAQDGDTVLVMGARDDTLTDFCRDILGALDT